LLRRAMGEENEYAFQAWRGQEDITSTEVTKIYNGKISSKNFRWFLTNGGLFYVDIGSHPEYSGPECANGHDIYLYSCKGETFLAQRLSALERSYAEQGLTPPTYLLLKNNVDSQDNTYGCHSNFQVQRELPFWRLVDLLAAFRATMILLAGNGMVVSSKGGYRFLLSQRAPFINRLCDAGTTRNSARPLFNTREEAFADPSISRRLHHIDGDVNVLYWPSVWKYDVYDLLLLMCENSALDGALVVALDDPVESLHQLNNNWRCGLDRSGRRGSISAVAVQRKYFSLASEFAFKHDLRRFFPVLAKWDEVLCAFEDGSPEKNEGLVDWVTKKLKLQRREDDRAGSLSYEKAKMHDFAYHPSYGLPGNPHLAVAGLRRLYNPPEVEVAAAALGDKPPPTRASLRGRFVEAARCSSLEVSVNWHLLAIHPPHSAHSTSRPNLSWVKLLDPLRQDSRRVEQMLRKLNAHPA
jgi:proteasome accessory factor A